MFFFPHQGIVVKLNDNSGFIKGPLDPQLFFEFSEVMDDSKLTLSEKVEFTIAVVRALSECCNIGWQLYFCPSYAAQIYWGILIIQFLIIHILTFI